MKTFEQHLRGSAVPRKILDEFLDRSKPNWAQFDAELGYTLGNSLQHDGLGGCWTISTTQANGARTSQVYSDRPCRINTYGNSFTQCHQVSDAETWQEYLAGHLGEPIRNFGVGGFGVYQAYRRLRRTETTPIAARHVILYIWGDDHIRSVMRCRYAAIYPGWDLAAAKLFFHANFWANIEIDPQTGRWVENGNLLPTPESLYRMTDPDFMYESLKDDLMVQLCVAGLVDPASIDPAPLKALANTLGVAGIDRGNFQESARRLKQAYGFAATKQVIEKTIDFCKINAKELLIVLACPDATRQLLRNENRYDQEIVNYLRDKRIGYFDMNVVHAEDYKQFKLSVDDYMKRYYIGHYNPMGNHLFAYSLKNTIVNWLHPKAITYRDDGSAAIDFHGYLQEP